jgi:hypothetical protein
MNYLMHYDRLIARATHRERPAGYVELHHVKPRCMGGDDSKENIVVLTPEEHFVAHQLLVKINPKVSGLAYAALMMTIGSRFVPRRNKSYGWLRRLVSEHKRLERTGFKHSDETKVKMSAAQKGKPLSEENKAKLKQAWERRRVEKPMTDETKRKLSLTSLGRKHSVETKAKLSAIRKANPVKRKELIHAA